ncbi:MULTISPECIES: excisionase family DNA-binding protein [unclassified Streptomyces]|uniref:excisionase family DNA-binding protein n=1 Tax=unclassified Streptomyces TaxID=2593676 RepID=UPI003BB7DAF0
MSPRTLSHTGAPPQKPQNPQKPRSTPTHLRRRPARPVAAKTRETAAQISTTAGPQHGPGPAAHFCGDSRNFCGNHPHTPAAAGQTARTLLFADSAVSAAGADTVTYSSDAEERAMNDATSPLTDSADDPTLVLLTVEEAARRLSIGRTHCFRLLATGELDSVTLGRARRVPAEAVIEFAHKLRTGQRRSALAANREGIAA